MKFFWCPRTRALRVTWMLEELGEPYERVLVDIRDDTATPDPDFLLASPMGKVPALADGEVKLSDSAAIGLYLADRYPQAGLAPAIDAPTRGKYLYWMVFVPGVVEPAMGEKVSGTEPNKFSHGWGDFDAMIATLEQGLKDGPWLLGDTFSAADVMIGSALFFLKQMKFIGVNPIFDTYLERCAARPAWASTMEIEGTG